MFKDHTQSVYIFTYTRMVHVACAYSYSKIILYINAIAVQLIQTGVGWYREEVFDVLLDIQTQTQYINPRA